MGPGTPEISISNNVTLLRNKITEVPGFENKITIKAENIGAGKWQEMLSATQTDGRERAMNVFYNPITKKFMNGNIIVGTTKDFNVGEAPLQSSEIGLRGMFYDFVANVHTHSMTEKKAHLKTTLPSIIDIQNFLEQTYAAGVTLDRGGAHLLIRTADPIRQDPPSNDLIDKVIREVKAKDGTVTDVQKKLNTIFSEYGIAYFYSESLTPSENGTITFEKP